MKSKRFKLLKRLFIFVPLFFILVIGVAYYLLFRPYEDLDAEDVIILKDIQPVEGITYPAIVVDTDSVKNNIKVEKNVAVMMSDGVRLSANVFRPKAEGKYPVVLSFTAYDKDKGPEEYPPVLKMAYVPDFDLGTFKVSPLATWEGPDPYFWVANGYAVIHVDSRGYFASEGDASLFDEQNVKDFHEIITWAGTQSWSNGNVGLNGVSYLAISQWVAASNNPPQYLKAIIPWEGATDSFREILYHGGIPETSFTRFWVNRVRNCANDAKPLPPFPIFKMGHKNPWLLKRIQKPPVIHLEEIKVPALVCATWSDAGLHTRGSFEGYKQISSKNKWLFTHGRQKWATYYSEEALNFQKRFFDYFLKGEKNGLDSIPSLRLEVRESLNTYKVRYEDAWPIPDTKYEELYLDANSNSLQGKSTKETGKTEYKPLEENAVFTYKFEQDTELSGNMKLKLWVSTDRGSDMDLFVAIKKLDKNGKEVYFYAKSGYNKAPAAMGWLRVSERELDTEKSTDWQPILTLNNPQKLSSNEIVPVEIEILPSSTFFKKGESLQVIVQGKDFFNHPSLGHHYSVNRGIHSIHTGGEYDSHLLVPVIP